MRSTLLTLTATAVVVLTSTSAGAIPDPDAVLPPPQPTAAHFPFDAGSTPVEHVPGQDWLPARRVG